MSNGPKKDYASMLKDMLGDTKTKRKRKNPPKSHVSSDDEISSSDEDPTVVQKKSPKIAGSKSSTELVHKTRALLDSTDSEEGEYDSDASTNSTKGKSTEQEMKNNFLEIPEDRLGPLGLKSASLNNLAAHALTNRTIDNSFSTRRLKKELEEEGYSEDDINVLDMSKREIWREFEKRVTDINEEKGIEVEKIRNYYVRLLKEREKEGGGSGDGNDYKEQYKQMLDSFNQKADECDKLKRENEDLTHKNRKYRENVITLKKRFKSIKIEYQKKKEELEVYREIHGYDQKKT